MAILKQNLAAIDKELKAAQEAYNSVVDSQESSTIINAAKARLDAAKKAYELSAPQRTDILEADPDVKAARKLQEEAAAEVKRTQESQAKALADLEAFGNAANDGPQLEVTQELRDATTGLDTNAGLGIVTTGKEGPTGATGPTAGRTVVSTFINPATGDTYALYSDGSRELLFKGTKEADAAAAAAGETLAAEQAAALAAEAKTNEGKSAYNLLFAEFDRYGLGALVEPLKKFIEEGLSPAEFTIRLRETDAYKKRFAANAQRVAKGLRALSEAEYIGTEDQYQDVMRRYGMPESYYAKGDLGVQTGFEKFLAGDVSAVELEDRIQTAQNRVVNSNPEVAKALKEFYPGISNGDILAYVLDPANAIEQIKRKVTAAEIGGAAIQSGLNLGNTPEEIARYAARANELAAAGITKQQAQTGFQTIAEVAPRGGVLAEIYNQSPYTQTTAEQEVFGLAGSVDAAKQRKKLTQLETASFSGSAGMGAIARDRAGAF
jgi:hypothetical protein